MPAQILIQRLIFLLSNDGATANRMAAAPTAVHAAKKERMPAHINPYPQPPSKFDLHGVWMAIAQRAAAAAVTAYSEPASTKGSTWDLGAENRNFMGTKIAGFIFSGSLSSMSIRRAAEKTINIPR